MMASAMLSISAKKRQYETKNGTDSEQILNLSHNTCMKNQLQNIEEANK